mgnify:CR=1 FL=1
MSGFSMSRYPAALFRALVLFASLLLGPQTLLAETTNPRPVPVPQEIVRLGFIDPLSGPFANAGESSLRHFRAAVETLNERVPLKGYKFTVTGFDNKATVQDSLTQLRLAIDQGYRFIVQGQSSAAALALSDAISKHNARDPARAVLLLNYAALDPDLTESKCSFWHFRFDASVDMRVEALGGAIEKSPPG